MVKTRSAAEAQREPLRPVPRNWRRLNRSHHSTRIIRGVVSAHGDLAKTAQLKARPRLSRNPPATVRCLPSLANTSPANEVPGIETGIRNHLPDALGDAPEALATYPTHDLRSKAATDAAIEGTLEIVETEATSSANVPNSPSDVGTESTSPVEIGYTPLDIIAETTADESLEAVSISLDDGSTATLPMDIVQQAEEGVWEYGEVIRNRQMSSSKIPSPCHPRI